MSLLPVVFLLILATGHAQPPTRPPGGVGDPCAIGGFIPRPCKSRLTCVLRSFGNPPVDLPRSGICEKLRKSPPPCTVAHCSLTGAATLCTIDKLVAQCGAWAKRSDLGGKPPDCNFFCTEECLVDRLIASDGQRFCNLCKLQAASCREDFEIFGPIKKDPCEAPISLFDRAACCIDRRIGCLPRRAKCSTLGSRIRPVPCKRGLTCVISDFGFPAADRPNSGRCRRVGRVKKCSVPRCSRFGPDNVCKVPLPRRSGIVSTCKAWARRSDGNPGPACDFLCPAICAVGDARPLASNGKRFCSICALQQKSCMRDFMIFGPVKP